MTETAFVDPSNSQQTSQPDSNSIFSDQPTQIGDLVVHTIDSPKNIDIIHDQWCDLSVNTSSANAFYEPAFFTAATNHLTHDQNWRIILILEEKTKKLVGFFPFLQEKRYRIFNQLSLWNSHLNYLTTPLIRSGYEAKVIESLFAYIRQRLPTIHLLEFPLNQASGRIHQELHTFIRNQLLTTFEVDHHARAELAFGCEYENYLKQSVGGHHLRGYRRQLRNLKKAGQVEFRIGTDPATSAGWSNWFLDLEAEGWKGREGTAMKQNSEEAKFFQELVYSGMNQKRLEMIGLFLDGEPIAMGTTLLSEQGAFAYKIAFNEQYKKYSPGILLQLHITERFLESKNPHGKQHQWLDSCAVPNHPMINRLWQERRSIQHLLVSTGRPLSNICLGLLPLSRAILRTVRGMRKK